MKIKNAIRKRFFTLVEVIVSMAVFAILMLGLMQFFSSAQNLWTSTGNRNVSYDEARTAMNMLAADLMCAYYEEGRTVGSTEDHRYFFIVQDPANNAGNAGQVGLAPALTGTPRFKGIAFATVRSVKSHPDAVSRLTEVFYRKNGNILEMRTIADNQVSASIPWVTNVRSTPFATFADTPFAILADAGWNANTDAAQQTADHATDNWTQIASNVVRFYVKVYPPNESSVNLNTPLQFNQIYNSSPASSAVTKFPGLVTMTLITIDDETAKKLRNMNPAVSVFEDYLNSNNDELLSQYTADGSTEEQKAVGALLKEKMQVFTRSVYIDRGIR